MTGHVEEVAQFPAARPAGVAAAPGGRLFVNFPRRGDDFPRRGGDVPFMAAEPRNGTAVPYPDAAVNRAGPARPADTLLSVRDVVADGRNRLWLPGTAAPDLAPGLAPGGR